MNRIAWLAQLAINSRMANRNVGVGTPTSLSHARSAVVYREEAERLFQQIWINNKVC